MLGSTESRDAQSANWKTDWTVQPDRRGLMRFTVELGPGLEFIAVSGPEVKEYQTEHEGEVARGQCSPLRALVGCRHFCISRLTPGCPSRGYGACPPCVPSMRSGQAAPQQ